MARRTSKPRAKPVAKKVGEPQIEALFRRVAAILDRSRAAVARSVNSETTLAYWQIGQAIVDNVQAGDDRAEYGHQVISELSARLTQNYGRGFSTSNLWYFRQFYLTYADRNAEILHKPCGESLQSPKLHKLGGESSKRAASNRKNKNLTILADLELAVANKVALRGFSANLSWSHYRTLCKVEHKAERLFYEIEAEKQGWSVPQLERQIHTLLFTRLLKSRDKNQVLRMANEGHEIRQPIDALKDPYVLDFLALPDGGTLRESDLETAIINQLQDFLLELGKGFAFVARQKRLAFDDQHFYVDLVFYHTILKCYVLIDLKVGKLSHQDIGQIDSYVRMFDDQYTTEGDNPTIGLILCAEKNDAVARYSVLNESKQIFAAKYLKYLPSESELRREIVRERILVESTRRAVPLVAKTRVLTGKSRRKGKKR